MEENEETHKKEFVKSGVKMKMAGETPFEPDINVWMELMQKIEDDKPVIYREALIMKDRSGLIDGKTFKNPTFKDFEPVVKYLLSVEKGDVKGPTNNENIAPSEEWNDRREKREIENEKIKSLFDKFGFGTSKEDKQRKVLILEKIFGTSSGIEIEKMFPDKLKSCREELEVFFAFYPDAPDKLEYINSYITTQNLSNDKMEPDLFEDGEK
jgi:hypothetical protein